jgi:hypothetical protein
MTPTLLRFAHLKARGVVSNWVHVGSSAKVFHPEKG